jgi:hypothetical protein
MMGAGDGAPPRKKQKLAAKDAEAQRLQRVAFDNLVRALVRFFFVENEYPTREAERWTRRRMPSLARRMEGSRRASTFCLA